MGYLDLRWQKAPKSENPQMRGEGTTKVRPYDFCRHLKLEVGWELEELLASPVLVGSPGWGGEVQFSVAANSIGSPQCPGSSEELRGSLMPTSVWAQPCRDKG